MAETARGVQWVKLDTSPLFVIEGAHKPGGTHGAVSTTLSQEAMDYYGIPQQGGFNVYEFGDEPNHVNLWELNDMPQHKLSFSQIADIVEAWAGLSA